MSVSQSFDVVVVGAGITGLSTAFHLKARGIHNVAISSADGRSATQAAAGIALGGQNDNWSRVAHAHGPDFAAQLWRFGDEAWDRLRDYCDSRGISFTPGGRQRLVISETEHKEVKVACAGLVAAGFSSTLRAPRPAMLSPQVIAVQDDGHRGACFDVAMTLARLANDCDPYARLTALDHIDTDSDNDWLQLTLVDGSTVRTRLLVLACHLAAAGFVPQIAEAFVSVADQWLLAKLGGDDSPEMPPTGWTFSANNTYFWGAVPHPEALILGGGRFLRPMAGIEAQAAEVDTSITEYLLEQADHLFPWLQKSAWRVENAAASLDCRPCDELPIIGPMFGDGRVLLATGYMGSGLTMGFYAGCCLAELIETGRCVALPRRLWPERLRTLEA